MTEPQRAEAKQVLKHNLAHSNDWIVLNATMQTLGEWAMADDDLKSWLTPHLEQLASDSRKSVSKKASKLLQQLDV